MPTPATTYDVLLEENARLRRQLFEYTRASQLGIASSSASTAMPESLDGNSLAQVPLSPSEIAFEVLFASAEQGFCVIEILFDEQGKTVDYRFIEINPAFEKLTGLHNAIGKTARQLLPDLEAHWFERYGNVAITGQPLRFTEESAVMDHWYDVYAFRLGGQGSRIVALLFTDVTERTRSEMALRESEARFRGVQDTSIDGFMVFQSVRENVRDDVHESGKQDADMQPARGRIVDFCWLYANEAAERIVGRPRSEFIGKNLLDVLPGNRTSGLFDAYVRVVETGQTWSHEFTYRYDGLDLYIRLVAARAGDGFAVTFADLSERRRAEERVRESEIRFRQLADAMPQIVWSNTATGQVNYLNQQWLDYTGLSMEESLRDPNAAIYPADRPVSEAAWLENLKRGQPFEYEMRLRRHDGVYRWHLARCVPVRAGDESERSITGWYGTSTDIHARKLAEQDARFLADLGAMLNGVPDPQELMWQAVRATATHLSLSRMGFSEVNAQNDTVIIHQDYGPGLPSIAGTYPISFLGPLLTEEITANAVLTVQNARHDSHIRTQGDTLFGLAGSHAFLVVPLLRAGEWRSFLWAARPEPHTWDERETNLLRTVAERVWLAVESARVQAETQALNTLLETKVAERTQALHESRTQLRQLSAYVQRTREDERTRIAREVHDQLGGSLTALKMSLARSIRGRVLDADLTARFQDLRNQIDEVVEMVRRIASDLRPAILDDFGLVTALGWQAREWEKHTGIAFQLDLPADEVDLNRECRTAIFRVFQESLTNIARHAQATHVTATLRINDEQLWLTVRDDGRGITAEALRPGRSLGLLGMRERMREVNGDVEITGEPGLGTTVTIRVPLPTQP